MNLTVELITSTAQLTPQHIDLWNSLAASPFQRWEWLGSWCNAYGTQYLPHILVVKRDGEIIAIAPWCLEHRVGTGRTIQFLGSGKACSDHMSLLVPDNDVDEVCDAIAGWLLDVSGDNQSGCPKHMIWDSIELIGSDMTDRPINALVGAIQKCGLKVQQTEGQGCYIIDLPEQWEDYIKMRSKSGRREIRQSQKNIDDGTIAIHTIQTEAELEQHWESFVDLHQRRRHASGTSGCFDHPPFDLFLREAASRLLEAGMLRFVIASIDGHPVATQFSVVDDTNWYFYQSGMEPEAANVRPGLSVFTHAIRETIQNGLHRFDMMRGDEPYKLRWRAELQAAQEVRVVSPRAAAQARNNVYTLGVSFKNALKSGMSLIQAPQGGA